MPLGVENLNMAMTRPTPPPPADDHNDRHNTHHNEPRREHGGPGEMLKVSTKSNPNSVAGAIAGVVREAGSCELQVVGAGALNQAIKAMAIARGYVTASGIDLVCVPNFADIEIDGERRTAIRLCIGDRHHTKAPSVPNAELRLAPDAGSDRSDEGDAQ